MNLFHEYQGRTFQFALDVLAGLECRETVGRAELDALARKNGLDYAGQVLEPMVRANLLAREGTGYRLGEDMRSFRFPAGEMERDYLAYILSLPEAELFLDEELRAALAGEPGEFFAPVRRIVPRKEGERPLSAPQFRTLLTAIRDGRKIRYSYRTREREALRESETVPWKLEYSAYDGRWWVILYDPEENRTIKAVLGNLQNIRLAGPADVTDEMIEQAMEPLLAPEPVVLQMEDVNNVLERCFLVFENQLFQETEQIPGAGCRVAFRYYRFDEEEILRRLLYMGPDVTLVGPQSLREKLARRLEQALAR